MTQNETIHYLDAPHGSRLAWSGAEIPDKPTILFFAGHGSDMQGTKALAVAEWAERNRFGMLRFDYSGHGLSSGEFLDGTIGAWKADCLAIIDALVKEPLIIIGSSLGGWLMMLAAMERKEQIIGLIGIAAAPDFTEELIWQALTPQQQEQMQKEGQIALPNPYADEDVIYPYHLITEGREHLILDKKITLDCPVRLLHGMQDEEVPYKIAERLADAITSPDIEVVLDKNAGHRFSEPDQIDLLLSCLDDITLKA